MKNSKVDKYLFDGGYAQASVADFLPYKYNGKELDKMHGLNTYDHGARQYDPILLRCDRIDQLCEKGGAREPLSLQVVQFLMRS